MKLGVLDYGAGNLRSVFNALAAIAMPAVLVSRPQDFDGLDLLVFPGQGAFGDSVRILKERSLWQPLQEWLREDRPYLGICLGYQLLFEGSEESPGVQGLGIAPGRVRRFQAGQGLKIPHMGWNQVRWQPHQAAWWQGMSDPAHLYFVHSYYPEVADSDLALCTTDYGITFTAGIARPNLIAVQFHPEKSQATGLTLLRNALGVLTARL